MGVALAAERGVELAVRCAVTGRAIDAVATWRGGSTPVRAGGDILVLPAEGVDLTLSAAGYSPHGHRIGPEDIAVAIELHPTFSRRVMVRDRVGRAVAGATIDLHDARGRHSLGITDASGEFVLRAVLPVLLTAHLGNEDSPLVAVEGQRDAQLILGDDQAACLVASDGLAMTPVDVLVAGVKGSQVLPFRLRIGSQRSEPMLAPGDFLMESMQYPWLLRLAAGTDAPTPRHVLSLALQAGESLRVDCVPLPAQRVRAVSAASGKPLTRGWCWAEGYELESGSGSFGWSLMGAVLPFDASDGIVPAGALMGGSDVQEVAPGHVRIGVMDATHLPSYVAWSDLDPLTVRDVPCRPGETVKVRIDVSGDDIVPLSISRVVRCGGPSSAELPVKRVLVRGSLVLDLPMGSETLRFRSRDSHGAILAELDRSRVMTGEVSVPIDGLSPLMVSGVPDDAGALFASQNGITLYPGTTMGDRCFFRGLPRGSYEVGGMDAMSRRRQQSILMRPGRILVPSTSVVAWGDLR